MTDQIESPGGGQALLRLQRAINAHDLEQLLDCFAEDVDSRQPLHADRHFAGRVQVRRNWTQIFAGVPDLRAELIATAIDGDTAWAEWRWFGTRRDGAAFELRGVTIHGLFAGRFNWVRLYMEPVATAGLGNQAAIQQAVGGASAR